MCSSVSQELLISWKLEKTHLMEILFSKVKGITSQME